MSLSDKECNILTNKVDMDKSYDIVICPKCRKQTTSFMENTPCPNCSEKDVFETKWIKRVNFIKITMRGKESQDFKKGFFTENVKEFIQKIKKPIESELNMAKKFKTNTSRFVQLLLGEILKNIDEEVGPKLT